MERSFVERGVDRGGREGPLINQNEHYVCIKFSKNELKIFKLLRVETKNLTLLYNNTFG